MPPGKSTPAVLSMAISFYMDAARRIWIRLRKTVCPRLQFSSANKDCAGCEATSLGIKVDGEPHSRDFRVAEKDRFDPQQAFEMAHLDSGSLGEIVHRTNKESNNLYAELILRTLGKERGATAPDPRKNRERGDDEAG